MFDTNRLKADSAKMRAFEFEGGGQISKPSGPAPDMARQVELLKRMLADRRRMEKGKRSAGLNVHSRGKKRASGREQRPPGARGPVDPRYRIQPAPGRRPAFPVDPGFGYGSPKRGSAPRGVPRLPVDKAL